MNFLLHSQSLSNQYITLVIVHNEIGTSKKTYQLSGVAEMDGELLHEFIVPLEKDKTLKRNRWKGGSQALPKGTASIFDASFRYEETREPEDIDVYGFPIHAHCWTLIERIIGPCAEKYLGLFFLALESRWMEEKMPFQLGDSWVQSFEIRYISSQ